MSWIQTNIHSVLLVSGVLTCTMIPFSIAPRFANRVVFGEDNTAPSTRFAARSWGEMIFTSGLMLIYAAWHPEARLPIMLYSIAGKSGFILLTALNGRRFLRHFALPMAIADSAMVALFAWYLLS